MERKKAIGLLINAIDSDYNSNLWQGIFDGATARNCRVHTFLGGAVLQPTDERFVNSASYLYDHVDIERLDGLILISTTISNICGAEYYERFCSRFRAKPLVSIGNAPAFVYKCLIDNRTGMYQMVDHLIKDHGCRELAFISGPQKSAEANLRFDAFKKALEDNQLAFNENYFFAGGFSRISGEKAADYFFREKKYKFDALVAANDEMALAAAFAMQRMGMKIPQDVRLVGFDDVPNALVSSPPLSTVRQPIYSQAVKATSMLLDLIEGKPVPKEVYLPTFAVKRQSCGCDLRADRPRVRIAGPSAGGSTDTAVNKAKILAEIKASTKNIITEDKLPSIEQLIDLFYADLDRNESSAFLDKVKEILEPMSGVDEINVWQDVFIHIERGFSPYIADENFPRYEELIEKQNSFILNKVMAAQSRIFTMYNLENRNLRDINRTLGSSFDIKYLHEFLMHNMRPILKIPCCYVGVFDEKDGGNLRLLAGYDRMGQIDVAGAPVVYPAKQLVLKRSGEQPGDSLVIFPMIFNNRKMGLVVIGVGNTIGYIYESVSSQIVSAVLGSYLLKDSRESRNKLEIRNERIESLVKPMIDLIKQVADVCKEKVDTVNFLNDISRKSFNKISETAEIIQGVAKKYSEMMDIINIIDDISATVKLVSINASIESTHAGDYGAGFYVIAKEIKKLSESTKTNAEEISQTLRSVIQKVEFSIKASQDSIAAFREQEKGVGEILDSLKLISSNMENLAVSSTEILSVMD